MAKKAKKNNKRQNKKKQDKAKKRKDKQKQLRLDNKAKSVAERRRQQSHAHHHHHHHDGVPCNHDHSQDFTGGFSQMSPLQTSEPQDSQVVYNNEPVAFTFEYPLMSSPARYLDDKITRVNPPKKSDSLNAVKSIVADCFKNMSTLANAIMNTQTELSADEREHTIELLQDLTKSPSIAAATRSYAAAKLVELGQDGYADLVDENFPLNKNTEKLNGYKTSAQLNIEFFVFHQLINSAVSHTFYQLPKSDELVQFYHSIIADSILDPKSHALACARLLNWGCPDDQGTIQAKVDELESQPEIESQLCGVFSQSYLAEKKVEMWTSDRVINSKSPLVQLIGGVYKTYDENADPALADELAAIWEKLDENQSDWFFRILFEHPKTEVFKQFLNKACEAIESEELFDLSREVWSIWGVDPSPKLMERYGWNE